ncbi:MULTISPECIES: ABC transporter ATP-binding protein [unclassified Leifsonia]|uniref:ABC transporter ATP-binding protein n=1 Tax=unclassified Leifsonia TaxID=2663824 RepID=UPI0008A76B37|nr:MULTISPECIES: ABC transporter ATP-binding protein [unclassified Leifsonia]SEH58444.1 ATP-binding cassette, subfamily B [Leifsonia sp. CL154]SFL20524.1 ATP-binding cassette, subfamily B [Leifsonia sp. CL147]
MARTTERKKRGGRPEEGQTPAAKDIVLDQLEEDYDFTPGEGDGDMFGGVPAKKAENFWPSFKRLMGLLKPEWLGMTWVTLLTVVSVVLVVIAPKILGDATNVIARGVYGPHKGIDFTELGRLLTIVLAMYFVAALLQWWQGYLLNALVMRVVYGLRKDVEAKLNRLPLSYFDTRQRGDLMSRVTNDVDNIQTALQQAFSQLIQSVLMVLGIGIMMFIVSWQLALIALISIPLSGVIAGVIGSRSQKLFKAQWASTGTLNGHIEESYSGLDLVRAFGRDAVMLEEFDARNAKLHKAQVGAQFVSGSIMPAMNFVSYLSYVLIAVVGALRVAAGQLTIGDATAFIQYSREFSQPIGQIAGMANMLQSGVASAERTFEFLDSEEQEAETATEHLPERADGRVELDHVDFSYDPEAELIRDLSLSVQPGSTVAIVGPTGAGKTTLVNLIMRFYELTGGAIRLDGVDTRHLSRDELRGQVGMVLQDAWLFSGTIRENIRYGRLDATDEEVIAAAKATMVDRFVRQLPDGYDTVIDTEGGNVSAGERQLITIARAFIANPSLLILDEATSSVDTRTELLVQHAMAALRTDRTSFVIAHRLSTIRDAHTILVMEQGRIVEQGDHATLLQRRGAYYDLYMTQFRGDDAEAEQEREQEQELADEVPAG